MARVMVEVPLSLGGGIKMQNFSVWSLMHGHFKQSVCSCGASPTRPACRYLRRGRRVTGRGRSETPPAGTDPHSHLRDRN